MAEEEQIRMAAFRWLEEQALLSDVFPRKILEQGFRFQGRRVTLLGPQGIWKPKVFRSVPLSITTVPGSSYRDCFQDGYLYYAYRGADPRHPDNVGLSTARQKGIPLIYFHGILPGRYLAAWPVFIVAENPQSLFFSVVVDDQKFIRPGVHPAADDSRRRYITAAFKKRLHQKSFRLRVLEAYRSQCAFCRLRHEELLDAAHIIPDSDLEGEPLITNGLSLCKLHHAAFDRNFIGISPDYEIIVQKDLLQEIDGPMLRHGIQEIHGRKLILPKSIRQRPDRDRLAVRFEQFR
ncbi:MAG: HNH endonuclease, partial [Firmicutes bacterium]|nr:HNH endonuclease [Bacillota bacterium]